MRKLLIVTLIILMTACGSVTPTDSYKQIDAKVINQDLKKAKRAFRNGDVNTALDITEKYAKMGHPKSQFQYGYYTYLKFYIKNYGKKINQSVRRQKERANQESLKWITLSANQGYEFAQASLGMIYSEEDRGVDVDYVKALMWTILGASHSKDNSRLKDQVEQFLSNFSLTEKEIAKAKRMAKQWRPVK